MREKFGFVDYPVQAAIWLNTTKNGEVFYSTTFSRTYKGADNKYSSTDSYSGTQLLQLARVAQKAYDRTLELNNEAKASANKKDAS